MEAKELVLRLGLSKERFTGEQYQQGLQQLTSCASVDELVDKICSADRCKHFLADPANRALLFGPAHP